MAWAHLVFLFTSSSHQLRESAKSSSSPDLRDTHVGVFQSELTDGVNECSFHCCESSSPAVRGLSGKNSSSLQRNNFPEFVSAVPCAYIYRRTGSLEFQLHVLYRSSNVMTQITRCLMIPILS